MSTENKPTVAIKDLVIFLEDKLNLPENHHLIAVFRDNDSDDIIGWMVVEHGIEGDYPVYTFTELLEKYGKA